MIKIAPSILSADFSKLAEEIKKVEETGADYIHIDVMDGSFVPNITIGSPVVESLRKVTDLTFDVHLMVEHPETQIESFAKAGADIITFHIETTKHAHRVIQQIKSCGKKVGIALNPATPLVMVEEILTDVDMILLMTVNPGFGGQKFINSMLEKIEILRHTIEDNEFNIDIEVDGGINDKTASLVKEAGANILVAGSYVYGAKDVKEAINLIK